MKKILIITDTIQIDDSSGAKANVAFIENLESLKIYDIVVYHYSKKEILISGVKTVLIPEIKNSLFYILSRSQRLINRYLNVKLSVFLENIFGFSFTYLNDVRSIKKSLTKIDFTPNLVITLSKAASFRPHHAILSFPDFHSKWMAYIHDPYPMNCYPRPYNWVEPGYFKKMKFFTELSLKAEYPTFPSQLLKEWMGSYFENFRKRGLVIPHQSSKKNTTNNNFPEYFNPDKFNILHAGSLMKQRSPLGLLEGYKKFISRNNEAKENSQLLLIGYVSDYLLDILNSNKQEKNITIIQDYVPFEIVYNMQKNAAVNVILEAKFFVSPFLPGKFTHCVESNKPILALGPEISEVGRLLGESYKYKSVIDDIDQIADLIEDLYFNWKQNPESLYLNRKDLEDYLSCNYLNNVLKQLL